jgi:excinuclease UvrABC helicase subunit UvrB
VKNNIAGNSDSQIEPLRRLYQQIDDGAKATAISGLKGAARSFFVAQLFEPVKKSLLVICPE